MLTTILLIIIGTWLKAPVWYFVLCGLLLSANLITYGFKMYKVGRDE
jgi:hypothetical protein